MAPSAVFRGDRSFDDDPADFLLEIECETEERFPQSVGDEAKQTVHRFYCLKRGLQDRALEWFRQLDRKERQDWGSFKKQFEERWSLNSQILRQERWARSQAFSSLKQEPKETLSDYLKRADQMHRGLGMERPDGGMRLLEGLHDPEVARWAGIGMGVRGQETFEEAAQMIRLFNLHSREEVTVSGPPEAKKLVTAEEALIRVAEAMPVMMDSLREIWAIRNQLGDATPAQSRSASSEKWKAPMASFMSHTVPLVSIHTNSLHNPLPIVTPSIERLSAGPLLRFLPTQACASVGEDALVNAHLAASLASARIGDSPTGFYKADDDAWDLTCDVDWEATRASRDDADADEVVDENIKEHSHAREDRV
ncbi:hypothetical protein N7495_009040 [Penicillium taxi]|uniref:uncharacterized protein n=1 Tax=Penicillium taxi TaxID=168475 RepID=UPI002544DA99|nr:uncharacterized protein N7495_009040 [Penicillium taxi]KAJ5888999.1 hypothetical protein N7495_009040 [Penicillium taxi]